MAKSANPTQEMAYLQTILATGASVGFRQSPSGVVEVTVFDDKGISDVAGDLTPARALKQLRASRNEG